MHHEASPSGSGNVVRQQLEAELEAIKRKRGRLAGGLFVTLLWLVVIDAALPRLADRYPFAASSTWRLALLAAGATVALALVLLLVPVTLQAHRKERELGAHLGEEELMQRLRAHRDSGRWYLVMGVAMMFAGGLFPALAIGGALSVIYGLAANLYWSQRMKRVYDPWRDPELDRWEEEQMP